MKKIESKDKKPFKLDIVLSLVLHLAIVGITMVSSPFGQDNPLEMGEVIRVQLTNIPAPAASPPAAIKPLEVPQAAADIPDEIPISEPSAKDKVKLPEKKKEPEKKPEPKPEPKQQPQQPASDAGAASSGTEDESEEVEVGAPGSPFAGATIDNASFDYPYWFTQAFNKIAANFRNPVAYDGILVCVIYFQVIRSGRLLEIRVEKSSGIEAFDEACLRAIEGAAPFPPLPRDFREEVIGINIPFTN